MIDYDYGDEDIPLEDLAGYNTFDLTYDPRIAAIEKEEAAQKRRGYDDRDRYTNRADMHDTKPFERNGGAAHEKHVNPDGIRGKLEVTDTRDRRDGPGGD